MNQSAMNTETFLGGTGIPWDDWLTYLDGQNAKSMEHAAIARLVFDRIGQIGQSTNQGWWAQSVAISYEQHHGLRVVGQRSDGTFAVTASRTVPGTKDEVLAAWRELADDRDEFAGIPVAGAASVSSSEKWRYWRRPLADGSKISVNISAKPTGDKCTLAVSHDDVQTAGSVASGEAADPSGSDTSHEPSSDGRAALKVWWKDLLAQV